MYVLVLTSGRAEIYFVSRSGATLIALPSGTPQPHDATRLALQSHEAPWVILIDQSEESFWGGTMPPLRGAAKDAWINRMADQSGTDSPYRWAQVQGKSRSQEGQLRVLGYTLGRPEMLTPWLDALKSCNARIRGVYAPVMLVPKTLKLLKLKLSKDEDEIAVLVTPHTEGLRQTVLVGGRVRFSRLALQASAQGESWFHSVYSETTKLREYLIANGLLKNDRVGMRIDCVLPLSANGLSAPVVLGLHAKDRYSWLREALPHMVYVTALAAHQPWQQLAPAIYRKHDISAQGTRAIYAAAAAILTAGLLYVGIQANDLWRKQSDTRQATQDATLAMQRYQTIAKTFAATPLTSAQLIDMSGRWKSIQEQKPPDMREVLVAAGQVLERHPKMQLEEMVWTADVSKANDASSALGGSMPTALARPPSGAPQPANLIPPADGSGKDTVKNKKEITALLLRGHIQGIASDDLRGTRDAINKLELDFNRQPNLRAEITKMPLDLSATSNVTGSGTQDKSELSFEIKLWQR